MATKHGRAVSRESVEKVFSWSPPALTRHFNACAPLEVSDHAAAIQHDLGEDLGGGGRRGAVRGDAGRPPYQFAPIEAWVRREWK
jgi:hypothetical protein